MKTFLITFSIVQFLFLCRWLMLMFVVKPTYKHKTANTFLMNWKEGGDILLSVYSVVALFLSLCISLVILIFNYLEK
jgi:hypothetical protein